MDPTLMALAVQAAIHFMGAPNARMLTPQARQEFAMAMDAQPSLVTTSNSGIPAFLTTYIDPQLIKVLLAPVRAAEILGGEVQKGSWIDTNLLFQMVEPTGETSVYGDYSTNGMVGVNTNWLDRQPFHYQVMVRWGEKELARAGAARLDYAAQLRNSQAETLKRRQNQIYFYGVSGLRNYGLLNSPSLTAAITPGTKAITTHGVTWTDATAAEVIADIGALYARLVSQTKGLVNRSTPMKLLMSPTSDAVGMTKPTVYNNISVAEFLAKLYPGISIETAPEYTTAAGELLQLIVPEFEGVKTAVASFTELLRAHPMQIMASSFEQKMSQGCNGVILFRPALVTQMLGV